MSESDAVAISEARARLGDLIAQATETGEPVFLARHGRRVAAIIDADVLDRLTALAEDMEDIRDAQAARAEMADRKSTPIPWDEVKAELGLT